VRTADHDRPAHHAGRWIWTVLSIAFFGTIIGHLAELERLLRVASQGIWYLILLALLLEGFYLINQAALYSCISQLTDHSLTVRDLLLPIVAADFLEVAVPTPIGNLPGVALIVSEAEKHGMSRAEGALVNVIYFVLDYASFLTTLAIGLLYLSLFHRLKPYEVVAALGLSGAVAVSVFLLLVAIIHPAATSAWIAEVGMMVLGWWARLRHHSPPPAERVDTFAANLRASMELLRQGGRKLLPALLHTFAIPAINLLILFLLFLAFRSPVGFGVLVAGYAVGTLLMIIAITPSGLGPVEGMMILTYTSLGVPTETAALVTLLYRGITFWLPLIAGYFAIRRLQ
jgi:glycosyltransferase 2 family protein